jgi:pre-mRNA-processing factor 19
MAAPTHLSLAYYTLDVFTTTRYLGNPLAVVLVPAEERTTLTQERKQLIAREFNFSETVFLHVPPDDQKDSTTRNFDIFLVDREITFAGHPTIGTAVLALNHLGWSHVDTLVAKAGPIRITNTGEGGARADIPHAVHIHDRTLGDILNEDHLQARGLSKIPSVREAELRAPVVSIVRGMTFILVKLASMEELGRLEGGLAIKYDELPGLLDQGPWADSFVERYYYVDLGFEKGQDGVQKRKLRTRNLHDNAEDPATGSAACTLTSYLTLSEPSTSDTGGKQQRHFEIMQGVEMGRKSDIVVDMTVQSDGKAIKEVVLGGSAVVVMKGTIEV